MASFDRSIPLQLHHPTARGSPLQPNPQASQPARSGTLPTNSPCQLLTKHPQPPIMHLNQRPTRAPASTYSSKLSLTCISVKLIRNPSLQMHRHSPPQPFNILSYGHATNHWGMQQWTSKILLYQFFPEGATPRTLRASTFFLVLSSLLWTASNIRSASSRLMRLGCD